MSSGYNIFGIDIALRSSGIALYNSKENRFPFYGTFKYAPKFDYSYESIVNFKVELEEYMENYVMPYADPNLKNLFVVEGISRKGHFHTTIKIMMCRTTFYEYVYKKEQEGMLLTGTISPTVQEWKKHVVGKSNATKIETYNWLVDRRSKFNVPLPAYNDDDIVDAVCLSLFGLSVVDKHLAT